MLERRYDRFTIINNPSGYLKPALAKIAPYEFAGYRTNDLYSIDDIKNLDFVLENFKLVDSKFKPGFNYAMTFRSKDVFELFNYLFNTLEEKVFYHYEIGDVMERDNNLHYTETFYVSEYQAMLWKLSAGHLMNLQRIGQF